MLQLLLSSRSLTTVTHRKTFESKYYCDHTMLYKGKAEQTLNNSKNNNNIT